MNYAVIMAGGIGSRFWPRSRKAHPKQFLNVFGETTLIQNTVARLQGIVPLENTYVVTNARYVDLVTDQLPGLPAENVLAEPIGRNTAPCIEYAAEKIYARDPEGVMVVLPSDHVIGSVKRFHDVLRVAIDKASQPGALVTIGINPTHPETGYGYIQFDGSAEYSDDAPAVHRVKTFAEKPDTATAERFLDSGDFLWNSGMFIWRADTIRDAVERHAPEVCEAFRPLRSVVGTPDEAAAVEKAYRRSPHISIDYGVMERAENVFVVPGSFGWSDVGDWRAVYEHSDKDDHGNAIQGNVIMHDSSRTLVQARERLVVMVGVHDLVVVDTPDALLVGRREAMQQVKNVVEYLHAHQLEDYV
jgi:mannose-1-phosphate guanylyltransferase